MHGSTMPTHPMVTQSKLGIIKPRAHQASLLHLKTEPTKVYEALQNPQWQQAMNSEYQALMLNYTWKLVPYSSTMNVIGNKWIFKLKTRPDGFIERHKVRLVAKGFHQTPGLDFQNIFSLVVKTSTIRVILTLTVSLNWPIIQLNVNNVFLNGKVSQPVFMHQPEGFVDPNHPHHVCLLTKALYGLRQAPRAWYDKLKSFLFQWGFSNSRVDNSLFFYHNTHGTFLLVVVYVDDILLTGNSTHMLQILQANLNSTFALKQLGSLHYFLGIKTYQDSTSLYLFQTKYVNELLAYTKMTSSKPCPTPMSTSAVLSKCDGELFDDPTLY